MKNNEKRTATEVDQFLAKHAAESAGVIAICLILLAGGVLFGCSSQNVASDDPALMPFASGDYEKSNTSESADQLYRLCTMQPEVLASTMSAFPTVVTEVLGLNDADPLALEAVLEGENGGELQLDMLGVLKSLMANPGVKYRFANYTGACDLLYLSECEPVVNLEALPNQNSSENQQNSSTKSDIADLALVWGKTTLSDAKVLVMSATYDNNVTETGYFYLKGGFQRLLPGDGGFD